MKLTHAHGLMYARKEMARDRVLQTNLMILLATIKRIRRCVVYVYRVLVKRVPLTPALHKIQADIQPLQDWVQVAIDASRNTDEAPVGKPPVLRVQARPRAAHLPKLFEILLDL